MFKTFRRLPGFTLIELLIVMSIIGVMATVLIGMIGTGPRDRARDAKRRADMKAVQTAMEQYFLDNDSNYPTDVSGATGSDCENTSLGQYFPGGEAPQEEQPGHSDYAYNNCDVVAAGFDYCVCADVTDDEGNFGAGDCGTPAGTDWFCVTPLQ